MKGCQSERDFPHWTRETIGTTGQGVWRAVSRLRRVEFKLGLLPKRKGNCLPLVRPSILPASINYVFIRNVHHYLSRLITFHVKNGRFTPVSVTGTFPKTVVWGVLMKACSPPRRDWSGENPGDPRAAVGWSLWAECSAGLAFIRESFWVLYEAITTHIVPFDMVNEQKESTVLDWSIIHEITSDVK